MDDRPKTMGENNALAFIVYRPSSLVCSTLFLSHVFRSEVLQKLL